MIIHALLTILSLPALCQETGVVGLASCEQLAPRELRLTVSLRNYGETFDRDLSAFIHFDRGETSERLYTQAPPGLRPIVAPTQSSAWTPDEIVTLTFGPVTIPTSTRRTVYVKLGLYDPGGGVGRFALVGADRTDRVLLGAIDCSEDACRWLSRPPTPTQDHAEQIGVRPRGLVRSMPDPPAVRFGEEDLDLWTVEPISGGTADLARTREDLCWSESSLEVTYTGEGLGSGFVLRPPQPLPVADEADVARIWIMGRSQVWVPRRPAEEAILSHWVEVRDSGGETRHLRNHHNMGYPYWYVARSRIPADWPRPLVCTGIGFSGCTNPQPRTFLL
ncbi:MAG TPA: hypothetical protein QGH10_16795, partial [Armatimonadota bacterium]|nr:hypothetical protein [Armatimonadota bacterium]